MSTDEFLKELENEEADFVLDNDKSIRKFKIVDGEAVDFCPITFLAYMKCNVFKSIEYADECGHDILHLDDDSIANIISAADNEVDCNQHLRSKLLKACGL